ncbi:MAG: hypothetical protein CMN30_01440 [Sandaracinus sp.]|nr:hypothetical protein [Sandaracinus sp.]
MTLVMVGFVGLAGCGGAAAPDASTERAAGGEMATDEADYGGAAVRTETTTAEPMVATDDDWDALLEADGAMDEALELAACGDAADHLEHLCDLAERICAIAEETEDSAAADRCSDGTMRCARGREAVADACD